MANPWKEIKLSDYENHMSLDSVKQLQAMNSIMKSQFEDFPVTTAMILGVAGGNGLEHVHTDKYHKVYGVDINQEYLNAVAERYQHLTGTLECLQVDLSSEYNCLPSSQLVIANLLIEYIGYKAFQNIIHYVGPDYVSCVIQINTDEANWVSDSPYLYAFDRLDEVHHQMECDELTITLEAVGYVSAGSSECPLPNGKKLVRLDYSKKG